VRTHRIVTIGLAVAFLTLTAQAQQRSDLARRAPAGRNRPAGVPDGYVITPYGYFHPSCVHELSKSDILLSDRNAIQHADGTIENIPPCAYPRYTAQGELVTEGKAEATPPEISGWVEYAYATTSTSFGELTASWPVPSAPTGSDGEIVYFFPGIQPTPGTAKSILQPVLQYGNNGSFGGTYWVIASWNCCVIGPTGHTPPYATTYYSTPITVNVGDTLLGSIQSTCSAGVESCNGWNVSTEDETLGKTTTLSNTWYDGQTFNWAAIALEAHYVVQCSDYPPNGSTTFSNIALYDYIFVQISNPGWTDVDNVSGETPQCNYGSQVSATQVTLEYGIPPLSAGTSPSIAGTTNGGWESAFQANTGDLWIYGTDSSATEIGIVMDAGTSPSITGLSGGGWELAFQANTGDLYVFNYLGSITNTGLSMMAGTSPSITGLSGGGWEVAFQANTGDLYTYDSNGTVTRLDR